MKSSTYILLTKELTIIVELLLNKHLKSLYSYNLEHEKFRVSWGVGIYPNYANFHGIFIDSIHKYLSTRTVPIPYALILHP